MSATGPVCIVRKTARLARLAEMQRQERPRSDTRGPCWINLRSLTRNVERRKRQIDASMITTCVGQCDLTFEWYCAIRSTTYTLLKSHLSLDLGGSGSYGAPHGAHRASRRSEVYMPTLKGACLYGVDESFAREMLECRVESSQQLARIALPCLDMQGIARGCK